MALLGRAVPFINDIRPQPRDYFATSGLVGDKSTHCRGLACGNQRDPTNEAGKQARDEYDDKKPSDYAQVQSPAPGTTHRRSRPEVTFTSGPSANDVPSRERPLRSAQCPSTTTVPTIPAW